MISDDNYRNLYDPVYDSTTILERIADQTFLLYYRTKKVVVVGPRDFVLMIHFNYHTDGALYALVMESGLNHLVPESKGIVRGLLPMGGWRIEPMKNDPSRCKADYIAEIDLKGNIPSILMKVAIKDQGYQVVKLG